MKNYKILITAFACWVVVVKSEEVVFIDPVVNLCSEKLSRYGPVKQSDYDGQPFSDTGGPYDCMRSAQALFNEVGTVIAWDKKSHELCVEMRQWVVESNGQKQAPRFWCWDSHVIAKDVIKKVVLKTMHILF